MYRVRVPLQYQGSPPARDMLDVDAVEDEGAGS